MPNEVIDCIHVIARRSKSSIGLTFVRRYGTDIIDEPVDKLDRDLEYEDSDYNPDDDDTNTYDSGEDANYDHNIYLDIVGVYPNKSINNNPEDE